MAKTKPQKKITEVQVFEEIDGDGDVRWFVEYKNLNGAKTTMGLDAETLEDAVFEAAGATGVDQSEVGTP